MPPITSDAIYDGFSFKDNGLVLTRYGHLRIAPRNNQIENLANRTGGVQVQSLGGVKTINLQGYYIGPTIYDVQVMYDTIAAATNKSLKTLLIPHTGTYRKYIATPNAPIIEQPEGVNRLEFDIDFVVPAGFSISDNDTTFVDTTITSPTANIPISIQGTERERPYISLTYSGISGGTSGTVTLRNGSDLMGISITRNFSTGDVVTIDSENFQIFINGVLTAPNGRLPTWLPGSGSIVYSDTFTTRSVRMVGTYKARTL